MQDRPGLDAVPPVNGHKKWGPGLSVTQYVDIRSEPVLGNTHNSSLSPTKKEEG